ncbi:hypothetical protein FGIG_08698 [Fasciola gigantica]|uniref:Apple domain-containing protein n=1 Tax=Fasciola gigantica TaxID=46835 RepID=A0A504YN64_FASGI|nr:hypothetical protein FGIG_08698 [Fasciola gigantica]
MNLQLKIRIMSPKILVICFIKLSIWKTLGNSSCPSNLTEVGPGICMLVIKHTGSYCKAHELCETEGQARGLRLFVPGRNAHLITALVPPVSIVFTGISAFLNQSINYRDGWRYGDPGWSSHIISATDASIPWYSGEPNEFQASIALLYWQTLCDDRQFARNSTHVVCEMSNYQLNGSMEPFKQNMPYSISIPFFAHNHSVGCFILTNETTIIQCALRCKLRIVCRSFYFNTAVGLCALSLYVDSLLPQNMSTIPGTWTRFGRPNG